MKTFIGRLAIYRVPDGEVETRVDEQNRIVRVGIPQLYLWALPDEGDTEAVLYAALGRALDELWNAMETLFDNAPTADECELITRFCSLVHDVEPFSPCEGYLAQAEAAAKKRLAVRGDDQELGVTLGQAMLGWYKSHVLDDLYAGGRAVLGGDSIFGWRGPKSDG